MWFSTLTLVQQIFFCIAVPASILLVLQIILMLIGFGDGTDIDATEVDLSGDGAVDAVVDTDPGLSIFTMKTLTAFFTIGGWVGFTLGDGSAAVAVIVAILAGTAALFGVAFLLRAILGMQSNGNINLKEAVGSIADVYLTIPVKGNGSGKVNLTLSERFVEYAAIQNGETPISTGSKVRIIDVVGDSLVVEAI